MKEATAEQYSQQIIFRAKPALGDAIAAAASAQMCSAAAWLRAAALAKLRAEGRALLERKAA
jgi:hypothetical protein